MTAPILFVKAHPATRTMRGGDPTPEQATSGKYPKERMPWHGLTIAIEHPEGTVREGVDETGKAWRTVFRYAYGEILGTLGLDGDPVDVFVGSYPDAPEVYVVQQMKRKQWDTPDEQKCMINFASIDEAKAAYLGHYDDPRFFGGITAMPVDEFVAKVRATRQEAKMIKSQQPVVLFFKAHVGPYLRGGKVVNLAGYQGRQARAVASPGQMSLFGSSKPLPPSPLQGKDAVAHTQDMFGEDRQPAAASTAVYATKNAMADGLPQTYGEVIARKEVTMMVNKRQENGKFSRFATGRYIVTVQRGEHGKFAKVYSVISKDGLRSVETAPNEMLEDRAFSKLNEEAMRLFGAPSGDLIAEHERLVDVLNSPSHADDKIEAKKQADELADMKREVRQDPNAAYNAAVTSTKDGPTDDDPRRKFYVTVAREGRGVGRLAGPFDTHDEAKAHLQRARDEAHKVDPRSVFDAFGTVGVVADEHKPGVLNERLGIGAKPMTKSIVFLRPPAS